MDDNNRNFLLAIVLSIAVLFAWQLYFAPPEPQRQQQEQQVDADGRTLPQPEPQGGAPQPDAVPGAQIGRPAAPGQSHAAALAQTPRLPIDTPSLKGSIALRGARIDDLVLRRYHVSVKPGSDSVTLFSPSGAPNAYFAQYGWVSANGGVRLPDAETVWTAETDGPLTPNNPVRLVYDNGQGLIFSRTFAVDDDYMFTVTQEIENKSGASVTLHPYALIQRHGKPATDGIFVLHEGLIGVMGEDGLKEIDYDDVLEKTESFQQAGGWLGITDKYWAAALIPDQKAGYEARFIGNQTADGPSFQTDYRLGALTVAPGAKQEVTGRLFAGAKQTTIIDAYEERLGILKFEMLIDWGWFHFITKPLFYLLDFFYHLVGNFGVSILIVTVLVKLVFFPLANKSYESMSKMKKLQPEMERLRKRFKDDKMRQQQAMMELYKKEKVNPLSGCLPIVIQIPVFFALYKVLYVSIEMRHAPFFGWIQDLSARDPTSLFNLFGLIPWQVPEFLGIGIWPLIMGVSMFVQMRLNPTPADPVQQKIFSWMPVIFTFILAPFPAGLVIYWTWNNILSILQQWVIMNRNGVEVRLWENIGFDKLWKKVASSAKKT